MWPLILAYILLSPAVFFGFYYSGIGGLDVSIISLSAIFFPSRRGLTISSATLQLLQPHLADVEQFIHFKSYKESQDECWKS
jgi:hypothetical protein